MNKDLIKQFVLSSKYYSFRMNNYLIPSYVINKEGQKIDIEYNRNKELMKSSQYVFNFLNDIKELKSTCSEYPKGLFEYIREFPIIIDDKDLWNCILDLFGASKDCEYRNRLYFLIDVFFPISNKFIEIDSKYHKNRIILDKIRDKYLKCRYGIETIRFYEYGKSTVSRKIDLEYVKDTFMGESKPFLEKMKFNGSFLNIDYSEVIVNNFIRSNSGTLDFIKRLESYIGQKMFNIVDRIIVTRKDLMLVDSPKNNLIDGIFIHPNQKEESVFLISNILRDVFKKELIVHNSTEYTVRDVIWAIKESCNQNKWSRFIGTVVPEWIVDIFGYPPSQCIESPDPRYKIEIEKSKEKNNVLELVKLLTSEMPLNSY